MKNLITTGRVADRKQWEAAGWTVIDVTVKSAKNAKALAPTWAMVMGYKKGTISQATYTKQYREIIARSQRTMPEKWNNTIIRKKRIVFCCYCPPKEFCHRVLLANAFVAWGKEMGADVELIKETGRVIPA